jgi:hypothetical protein
MYGLTREHDGTDEYEWNAYDYSWQGTDLWPWPTDVIRSERDKNARSLAEFIAAW